nr:GNAT family N-acetyltransferase [Pseudoruegeria sp. HB172150]
MAGFVVVRVQADHLYLDHLYLRPAMQGGGRGRAVVEIIQQEARDAKLPLRLMALRDSPANGFYQRCGFRMTGSDEWDVHYEWCAAG